MPTTIRPVAPRDELGWRRLWNGYNRFYEHEVSEAITQFTWSRLVEPSGPMRAIIAEAADGTLIGFANYILHASTWSIDPVCGLEDLYVDVDRRAGGVGRMLIDWLIAEMKANHWAELYWITRENNYRARALYDTYTPHSGFLRYVIPNSL
jgi:GNAT superfamily N-acetyltransferase